jgi:hypothetical protein
MAENIVDSLFGLQPWQIQQQQNAALGQSADKYAAQDPFQRATGSMYRAGGMMAGPVAESMGYVNPAIEQAKMREQVMGMGGDLSTSAGLKAKASQFAQAGDQRTAMMLVLKARQMEADEKKALIEQRKQDLLERKQTDVETEGRELKKMQILENIRLREKEIESKAEIARQNGQSTEMYRQQLLELRRMGLAIQESKGGVGGKVPMGYRYTPEGNLEPIPGGPADAKANAAAEQKAVGAAGLDTTLATLRSAYDRLESGGGITSTKKSTMSNIGSSISSSGIGQMAGKIVGSENQSARNDVAMSRPALLASLMKATGMSAKQIDSNAELKLWLATATDPTLDVEANRRALDSIESRYLSGKKDTQSQSGWSIKKK